ncbi:hypothetical protein [Paenibacillus marinisediminis]
MGHFQANKGSCVREQAATIMHNWAIGKPDSSTIRERTVRTLFARKWGILAGWRTVEPLFAVEAADYSGLFTHNGSYVRLACRMGHF